VRFKKNYFSDFYNAGVVVVNLKAVGLAPGVKKLQKFEKLNV
jgi:hypothetical protein